MPLSNADRRDIVEALKALQDAASAIAFVGARMAKLLDSDESDQSESDAPPSDKGHGKGNGKDGKAGQSDKGHGKGGKSRKGKDVGKDGKGKGYGKVIGSRDLKSLL